MGLSLVLGLVSFIAPLKNVDRFTNIVFLLTTVGVSVGVIAYSSLMFIIAIEVVNFSNKALISIVPSLLGADPRMWQDPYSSLFLSCSHFRTRKSRSVDFFGDLSVLAKDRGDLGHILDHSIDIELLHEILFGPV